MKYLEAIKKIEEAGGTKEVFEEWMSGQTCSMDEDGEADIYDWDVARFIEYKCDPKNEPIEDWD